VADRIVEVQNFGIQALEEIPPQVISVEINAGVIDPDPLPAEPAPSDWATQRSSIATIVATFDEPILPNNTAITLTNLGVNAPADADKPIVLDADNFDWSGDTLTL
jgi:hypothetical protein